MQHLDPDVDLLYRLLEVDPAAGPVELLRRARGGRQLPYLVLAALAREGTRMGEHARAELHRARDRADCYARLARDLADATGVRPIRDLPLAGYYPPDLPRPVGELTLVSPTEAALWQAVSRLVAEHPVESVEVTLLGERPRHTAVTLRWPAADPLLDPWYQVRLATAALTGDPAEVPVRPFLAADDHVECLIALAEEGLGRGFRPGDVLDVAQLTGQPFDAAETAAVVAAYRLAPEAAALLDLTAEHLPLGPLHGVRTLLEAEVAPELERRRTAARPLRPRHGALLRRTAIRHHWDEAQLLPAGTATLLLTPVADYLLTPDGTRPTPAERTAALAALRTWDATTADGTPDPVGTGLPEPRHG
ncbi:hypothetical protein [Kitasatospora viridis]|uniref:Uncharacterized protein n=1 Tax=Kitasatospora viridis TaxID=281105 RepID=A0A561SDF6_9ACTN|nr:hypothetical protein [Kitasatospora viridis]TWF72902.1 hypothetical protein FHX73_1653 [Kitasatospora viridis]